MRSLSLIAAASAALLFAIPASAQFSVGGAGGVLNNMGSGGTGGGGNSGDTLPTAWSEYPASSAVPAGSTTIDSVTLTGLNHTWSGDLQIVLQDPNGVGYNLMVRMGVAAPAACCGWSADYGDDYTFLAAGDAGLNSTWPLANPGATAVHPGGNYPQEFGTSYGTGWVDGSDNVFNVDLASIPVVDGIWTLFVYDGAGGDTGDLGSWSMNGDGGGPAIGTNYCTAENNSTGSPAVMAASGSASVAANDLVLEVSGLPNMSFCYFLTSLTQGFVMMPPNSEGNLCLGGAIGRYVGAGQIQNSGMTGAASLAVDLTDHPQPTGSVSVMASETWNFTCWYRDANPMGATSNFADGYEITFN